MRADQSPGHRSRTRWLDLGAAVIVGFFGGFLGSIAVNFIQIATYPGSDEQSSLGGLAFLAIWLMVSIWFYRKRGRESVPGDETERQHISSRAVVVGIIGLALVFSVLVLVGYLTDSADSASPAEPSDEAVLRMQEIMVGVMRDPEYFTEELHNEFWTIVDAEGATEQDIEQLRIVATGYGIDYQRLFYQDALVSFRTGDPFASTVRLELENQLRDEGFPPSQFEENRELLGKIAAREPVEGNDGFVFIFDERTIQGVLAKLDTTKRQLDQLLRRPGS